MTPKASHSIAGVFEGGGAKGLAYVGALEAVLEADCWFGKVAGASAGAITAALVAAGFTPAEIREHASDALEHLKCGQWRGLWNLARTGGYLPNEPLLRWLDNLLTTQATNLAKAQGQHLFSLRGSVTFSDLYRMTGIELNVAAVDLSLKRQVVFSHWDTPTCEVAHAVVASTSIPFVFAPAEFSTDVPGSQSPNERFVHTIVDGGVWANFPMYIFNDRAFRQISGRPPDHGEEFIVGFVLQGDTQDAEPSLSTVSFVDDPMPRSWRKPWERRDDARRPPPTMRERLLSAAFLPFRMLVNAAGMVSTLNPEPEAARWPLPAGGLMRQVVDVLDKTAVALARPPIGLAVWVLVSVSTIAGLVRVLEYVSRHGNWWENVFYSVLTLLASGVLAAAVLALVTLLVALLANMLLLRALRRVLYGLVLTYIDTPGAPPWTAYRDDVIALPIPAGVSLLSFDLVRRDPEGYARLIENARTATREGLERILSRPLREEFERARQQLEHGEVQVACEALRRIASRAHPRLSPAASALLGEVLHENGDPAGAIEAFESAIASGGAQLAALVRVSLSGVLARMGRLEEAKHHLQLAIESADVVAAAEAQVQLGRMHVALGQLQDAQQAFARALTTDSPVAALKAAACAAVVKAAEGPANQSDIRQILLRAVEIDDAAPIGQKEVPSNWAALKFAASHRRPLRSPADMLYVALLSARDGNLDRMESSLHTALHFAMTDRDRLQHLIRLYLGDVLSKQRGADAAESVWQAAFESNDPDAAPEAAIRLGRLHASRGDAEAAAAMFRAAMASGRDHARHSGAVRLALLHMDQGRTADAFAALNRPETI